MLWLANIKMPQSNFQQHAVVVNMFDYDFLFPSARCYPQLVKLTHYEEHLIHTKFVTHELIVNSCVTTTC